MPNLTGQCTSALAVRVKQHRVDKPSLVGWVIALLAGVVSASADAPDDYDNLAGKKALAVAQGSPPVHGTAHSQAHDLAAGQLALQDCEVKRSPTSAPCELVRLNDNAITTAEQLRNALPKSPRPLYLWRYRGPQATVFLAGSVHLLKPTLYPLPEPFEAAFEQADNLVLEVDQSRFTARQLASKTLAAGTLPDGQTLQTVLPAPLYERLARRLAADGQSIALFQNLKPTMISTQLTVIGAITLGYSPESGLEQYFTAKRDDRPILELESIEAHFELLYGQPMALQVQVLEDTLDQEPRLESQIAELLAAWLGGADDELLRLIEEQTGDSPLAKEFTRQILDERNIHMTEKIVEFLRGRGTYFVLVGAAHFLGEQGIIRLLAERGIKGERIGSDAAL